jgi:hypothetical protein
MRESFKTFWVSSLVIHLQTICLLGTIGADLRGPLDNLFGAALKAMLKYLVFDLEFNFDSQVIEYKAVSPYEGLAYNNVNPYILQVRFLWIALYVLAYIFSVVGTRRFKTKFYHMRIGVLISTLPELIYFSITTMFSIGYLKIYNTFTSFSLLLAILTLIVILMEFLYIQLCSFKNLKFMLMYDTSRNLVDDYKFTIPEFLKLHSDFFFSVFVSLTLGFISQRMDVLGRILIGLAAVYILLNISRLGIIKPDFHKISHKLKLFYGALWIILMISVIELNTNMALGRIGLYGLSYFSMVVLLAMLIVLASIVVYRVFSLETPTGTEKPEATYKTNYVMRTYKRAKGKEGTAIATNPNTTTILADETFLSRTAAKLPAESLLVKASGGTPTSSALASMRRTNSKMKDPVPQSNSQVLRQSNGSGITNSGVFRLAELGAVATNSQYGSRPPSERANRAEKPAGALLDRFSSGYPADEPRETSKGRRPNPTSNSGSVGGSAKNTARGAGMAGRGIGGDDDGAVRDASPGKYLDQIFNRGGNQDRRSDGMRDQQAHFTGWEASDPKASINNLFQIKESRIEEASQIADLSYDINLAINDPKANLMLHKKSLRELMNEDSDKKSPEKSDPSNAIMNLVVGVEGQPNRASHPDNHTSAWGKPTNLVKSAPLKVVGIQDLEITPEN